MVLFLHAPSLSSGHGHSSRLSLYLNIRWKKCAIKSVSWFPCNAEVSIFSHSTWHIDAECPKCHWLIAENKMAAQGVLPCLYVSACAGAPAFVLAVLLLRRFVYGGKYFVVFWKFCLLLPTICMGAILSYISFLWFVWRWKRLDFLRISYSQ